MPAVSFRSSPTSPLKPKPSFPQLRLVIFPHSHSIISCVFIKTVLMMMLMMMMMIIKQEREITIQPRRLQIPAIGAAKMKTNIQDSAFLTTGSLEKDRSGRPESIAGFLNFKKTTAGVSQSNSSIKCSLSEAIFKTGSLFKV